MSDKKEPLTTQCTVKELEHAMTLVLSGAMTNGRCTDGQCGRPEVWMAMLFAFADVGDKISKSNFPNANKE